MRHVHPFAQVADVYQVMRHPGELGRRGLGRADVGAAVEEQRVARHDLRAVGLRPAERQLGLADGGATGEDVKDARHGAMQHTRPPRRKA
jgi:hypothetical protein